MSSSTRLLLTLAIGAALIFASSFIDELHVYYGAEIAVYLIAISSIVLLTGFSGQLSLGHGALMAIGAYSCILSYNGWHLPLVGALIVGALTTAFAGYILGFAAARLRGPYLAGATLALAVGIPSLANQFHVLGGETGLSFDVGDIPQWVTNSWFVKAGGQDYTSYKWYFLIAVSCALPTIWVLHNFLHGASGRRFKAMRSHPAAASLIGINIARSKVLAFTASSAVAGLAGGLFALVISTEPNSFTLSLSFLLVTGAVLSGISNLYGSIIGAMVLVAIPELSASVATHLGNSEKVIANLPGVITSLLLILTVLILPNGAHWKPSKS